MAAPRTSPSLSCLPTALTLPQPKHPKQRRRRRGRHRAPTDAPRARRPALLAAHLPARRAAAADGERALPARRIAPRDAHPPARAAVPRARPHRAARGRRAARRGGALGADVPARARPRRGAPRGRAVARAPAGRARRRRAGRAVGQGRRGDVGDRVGRGVGARDGGARRLRGAQPGGGRADYPDARGLRAVGRRWTRAMAFPNVFVFPM